MPGYQRNCPTEELWQEGPETRLIPSFCSEGVVQTNILLHVRIFLGLNMTSSIFPRMMITRRWYTVLPVPEGMHNDGSKILWFILRVVESGFRSPVSETVQSKRTVFHGEVSLSVVHCHC